MYKTIVLRSDILEIISDVEKLFKSDTVPGSVDSSKTAGWYEISRSYQKANSIRKEILKHQTMLMDACVEKDGAGHYLGISETQFKFKSEELEKDFNEKWEEYLKEEVELEVYPLKHTLIAREKWNPLHTKALVGVIILSEDEYKNAVEGTKKATQTPRRSRRKP